MSARVQYGRGAVLVGGADAQVLAAAAARPVPVSAGPTAPVPLFAPLPIAPPTAPAPLMSWQSQLRARRSARRYPSGWHGNPLLALGAMHDRVVDSMFRQGFCAYDSDDYARFGRAVRRQERAFSRMLLALSEGAR